MNNVTRWSYIFVFSVLILSAWFQLDSLWITILFSYFALCKLEWRARKSLAATFFVVVVLAFGYAFWHFAREAVEALPKIADTSIPLIIDYAHKHGVELPFTDRDSLKSVSLGYIKEQLRSLGKFAHFATKEFVYLIIGLVVSVSLFLDRHASRSNISAGPPPNLYAAFHEEVTARFRSLYRSFETVMGAQLIISAINTCLTAIFIVSVHLPYAAVVIGVTFLCGLLPIIGNLISNTVIVGIAFTVSPKLALAALTFLVVIHKLEYFLNSKIIGQRIKNPVWLTLLALIVGERLMGIPGMVLAPVILHFLKTEGARFPIRKPVPEPVEREELALRES